MYIAKFLLITLCLSLNIYPQFKSLSKCDSNCARITGRVIDSYTKEPLGFANILLDSTTIGAFVNEDGYYTVENIPPGLYRVKFSSIGYLTQAIDSVLLEPKAEKIINIEMSDWGEEWALRAKEDIENDEIMILQGGLLVYCAPVDEINKVCEEFGFRYEPMGCTFEWEHRYNEIVYEYLDKVNGQGWKEKFDKRMKELCEEYGGNH